MCKFCDLNNYTKSTGVEYFEYQHDYEYHIAGAPWTSLYMTYNSETNKFGIDGFGDYDAGIDIEYCPFCGRKLTEDNNV